MEWLAKQHEAASQRAPTLVTVATKASIPVHNKGKRKISDSMDEEQSYKL